MPPEPAPRGTPGDAETVERIYRDYLVPIYRFIHSRIGNQEDAEDLTSQVFLKAVRHLDGGRDEPAIRSWLFQLARTTIADHWRQYYKGPTVPLQLLAAERAQAELADADGNTGETLRKVLEELPEHYRRVLSLRFLDGLSVRETAAEMGLTEGNVKVLQLRALRRAAEKGAHLL